MDLIGGAEIIHMEQFKGNVTARLDGIDARLKKIDDKIEDLESRDLEIARFNELFKIITEQNKEFKDEFKQNRIAMVQINDNLTNLNHKFGSLDGRVGVLETDIKDTENINYANVTKRLDTIEDSINRKKIDVGDLLHKSVWVVIPGVILAYVVWYFGLK